MAVVAAHAPVETAPMAAVAAGVVDAEVVGGAGDAAVAEAAEVDAGEDAVDVAGELRIG